MSSRQLSSLTLDRLEESLNRFYLQERSCSATFSTAAGSSAGSSSRDQRFKLTATETKVVQETTHREVVLERYQADDHGDSDDSYDDDGPEEQQQPVQCYEVPSVEVVGYSESETHRYAEKESYSYEEEQEGSYECYGGSSGYDVEYSGGYELDSYGGQSDYDGYYEQDGYGDYY